MIVLQDVLDAGIQAAVRRDGCSGVVGEIDDFALVGERWWIAAMAQPHNVPSITIRQPHPLLLLREFPDRSRDPRCLAPNLDVPVHVVFEDQC